MSLPLEHSCGAVVVNRDSGSPHYVIVVSHRGILGFPKGHMKSGETERETALREILEETGLHVTLIEGFRVSVTRPVFQEDKVVANKNIVYFLAEYSGQTCTAQESEINEIHILNYEEALSRFQFESNRYVLQKAHAFLHSPNTHPLPV